MCPSHLHIARIRGLQNEVLSGCAAVFLTLPRKRKERTKKEVPTPVFLRDEMPHLIRQTRLNEPAILINKRAPSAPLLWK